MRLGKARFYADGNIEAYLVDHIRNSGYKVYYANELGFKPRDDRFHLQEARRRKCILLTRDGDFLDHRRYPFGDLKDTAIVILRSEDRGHADLDCGYMLVSLFDEIAASGNRNLYGLKIELQGSRIIFHANIYGEIKTDEVDISKKPYMKDLFEE